MENDKSSSKYGYQTADRNFYGKLKVRQNEFRKKPTLAEELLWKELQGKQTGYKFRRQHIIGRYVFDFVCLKEKLVIEVDGEIHNKRKEEDAMRTDELENKGYKVIRFTNNQIENDCKLAVNQIINMLKCWVD